MKTTHATPPCSLSPDAQLFFGMFENIPAAATMVCSTRQVAASRGEFSNLRAVNFSN
jgi:hypothetical protein